MKHLAFLAGSMLFITSCSSPGRATLLGAGIGSVAGIAVGLLAPAGKQGQFRAPNLLLGMSLGGLLGAGGGFIANELVSKPPPDTSEKPKVTDLKPSEGYLGSPNQPKLLPPQVETRFVDEQVRGGTFIPAHVEYFILEPAKWSH